MSLLDDTASSGAGAPTAGRTTSLEYPTMLRPTGLAPVMAIVEALTTSECRLRSVSLLEAQTAVAFDFSAQGVSKMTVHGRIVDRATNGVRHVYRIALDHLAPPETAILAQAAKVAQEHAAARVLHDVAPQSGLTRASVRVPVDLPVQFRRESTARGSARATNLSSGGMLLASAESLAVGASLDLRFTVPAHGLGTAQEVTVHGRIVAHHRSETGLFDYNIAFHDVAAPVRAHITAYVDRLAAEIKERSKTF